MQVQLFKGVLTPVGAQVHALAQVFHFLLAFLWSCLCFQEDSHHHTVLLESDHLWLKSQCYYSPALLSVCLLKWG